MGEHKLAKPKSVCLQCGGLAPLVKIGEVWTCKCGVSRSYDASAPWRKEELPPGKYLVHGKEYLYDKDGKGKIVKTDKFEGTVRLDAK